MKNIPDCTFFFLAKAHQKAHGLLKKELIPYGLTNMQHLILEGLWYQEGTTAAELGKLLILDKATLSGIIDRLGDGGWIEKRPDESDKRVFRLYPSKKANDLKKELIELRIRGNDLLLEDFTMEEKIIFKRLLRTLFLED
ncbi:MAG: MarR family transcriptional regulator [Proteobacteria bacterium]|nr:MarR family transcriptional regulator [Pseudomonadota bacterium]MBU1583178.1 MarR family transcriptional regulator [Pseudomonadota bacterium]MBU2454590.1 MarR family transcriptional regulator [Pseudomonadota bacterium]MBU2631559.1 MarR family transcriptional regulator [Pseudomonadota bacterium]